VVSLTVDGEPAAGNVVAFPENGRSSVQVKAVLS
jgi:hypothetical protein